MARDYAKQYTPRKGNKRRWQRWLVAGLIAIILIMVLMFVFQNKFGPLLTNQSWLKMKALLTHHPVAAQPQPIANLTVEPEVHFSFYNELPKMHIETPVPQPSSLPSKPNVAEKTIIQPGYVLQFGLFKESRGASELQLSLVLVGIEAKIEKIEEDHQMWYSVRQGPYATLEQVKALKKQSAIKGVDSVIKKQG